MHPGVVIIALWIAFGLSWALAESWSRRTETRLGWRAQLPYCVVLLVGGVIFLMPAHGYEGPLRLWRPSPAGAWICVGLIAAGFAFSWWARFYLGALWSGTITKKEDHRLIDTGPYAIVRHPIYSGILLAVCATAGAKGTILGLLGAAIIIVGVWMKARLEERWLSEAFGADSYEAYRRRVPMLIPFVRW